MIGFEAQIAPNSRSIAKICNEKAVLFSLKMADDNFCRGALGTFTHLLHDKRKIHLSKW